MMCEQNGNISKETENKKGPKRNSGAINAITEMKNSLQGFKGRFEQEEERVSQLEDRTMKIIEAEEKKEKRLKKSKWTLRDLWDTRVRSLGREHPLEKEMAIHSSTVPWKVPWTEEPGRLQSMGSQRVGHD